MCFYYAISKQNPGPLVKNKVIKEEQLKLFDERHFINGFNFERLPVVTNEKPSEIQFFSWGLIPSWVKNNDQAEQIRRRTLNAKSETVFEKPSFRSAIKRRRCLVLCSGFYEWQHYKGKKYPYFITLKDDEIFVFAGIWESYTDKQTGEVMHTYSILTTEANEMVAKIHHIKRRMPLVLPPAKALRWLDNQLDEKKIKAFFKPFDS